MRILVYSHHLEIGGSQTNAIDLAAGVRDLGHEVTLYATPGPAAALAADRGLELIEAPLAGRHPSPRHMRELRTVVRRRTIDLVHAYEWPQCLDAFYGLHLTGRVPLVFTVLCMTVPSWLPRSVPLVLGTEELVGQERRRRPGPVLLMEPPIDTDADHPGLDATAFRRDHGLLERDRVLVIVSRLTPEMKQEGVERAIEAVAELDAVRLVVVGDGPARAALEQRAASVNARLQRRAVVLTGALTDPRPAYAAADVVLGMGSSALRGMSFAKPLVVLGEQGFSEVLTPGSSPRFLQQGFYGLGDGDRSPARLATQLRDLLADPDAMRELGRYGRGLAVQRFALRTAVARLADLYTETAGARRGGLAVAPEAVRFAAHRAASELLPAGLRRRTAGMP